MSKSTLRILAAVLAAAIVAVLFAGFDSLPRELKTQIAAERTAYTAAQKQLDASKSEIERERSENAALFAAIPSARAYSDRLSRGQSMLAAAGRDLDDLARLEKRNRRTDKNQAANLLNHEKQVRENATTEIEAVRKDAAQWIERKQHLPQEVADMERDYKAIQSADLAGLTAAVQKAQSDWPDKRNDLENRLASVRAAQTRADQAWQSSAESRKAAAANDAAKVDYAALFGAADTLKTAAAELPKQTDGLKTLTAQLYDSWDKILADMRVHDGRNEQQIRTVRVHMTDASGKNGQTTSDEKWVEVSPSQYRAMERDLGMAIEHKAAGKYDIESERVAQPAGFAYMAPPGQRNQYGYWDNGGGHSFWVWYGQYALMRDLFFGRNYYRPIDPYEYYNYRTYHERRQTYYGEAPGGGARYGTGGTATQEHYSGSTFAKSGGFKDSKYANKPGGYNSSKYATPGGDRTGQQFGRQSSPPSQPRSFRPTPAPSRPAPSRSPGRSFGRRR